MVIVARGVKKKKRKTTCLPQEIVFQILLLFPAQVINDVMRHVCREWNFMIRTKHFIYDHLRNSTRGIVIQYCGLPLPHNGIYVEMERGCLQVSGFDSGLKHMIDSSCNGLVLDLRFIDDRIIFVSNPLTKQRAILPSSVVEGYPMDFSLAFIEASMKYKVVHTHGCKKGFVKDQIAVLTIGVDKVWRHIDLEHISLPARKALIAVPSLVTGGYVHWIRDTFILTLNVETEVIRQFPFPHLPQHCLPMGRNLSLIYESSKYLREIWEMNPETGEWTVLFGFDLEPLFYKFKDLFCKAAESVHPLDLRRKADIESVHPLGWLAVGEVLLFSCLRKICIAYNVRTCETQSFELKNCRFDYKPHSQPHVKSLVWLEKGSSNFKAESLQY